MNIIIRNKAEAVYALNIRKKLAPSKEERRELIAQASIFVPIIAEKILKQDEKKGYV